MNAISKWLAEVRAGATRPPPPDAVEAVNELIPEGHEFGSYISKFLVLNMLSAGVAAFGLLANSAAVVIGAMLIAPLMTPITAAAAATVMAQNVKLARSLIVIALGTATAIAVGAATAWIARTHVTAATELPTEVLSRTFPGLLDLGIAITAGAAAGYILPRRSTVSALPGVGIAVALIPPLAAVGITLAVGEGKEAANAFLLYLTNLAAIVFAASVMLLLSGFRPRVAKAAGTLTRRLAITLAAVLAVAIPLSLHTESTIREASLRTAVAKSVVEWDDDARVIDLKSEISDDAANVELLVSGPNEPRGVWKLASAIERRYKKPVDLRLLYQRDRLFEVSVR